MIIKELLVVALLWVSFQIKTVRAQQCGGYHSIWYNAQLLVENDEYQPYQSYYPPGISCKWEIEAPPRANFDISCTDINIPYNDNLYLFTTGRRAETIVDISRNFNLHEVWKSNVLSIELPYTQGSGRFSCLVQVIDTGTTPRPTTTTTPPPQPTCDCGWRYQKRIVGGAQTGVNEFPFMVGLVSQMTENIYCGGAIISEWFVLTAAHCIQSSYFMYGITYIVVGEHDVDTGKDTSYTVLYEIASAFAHPGYSNKTQENDIAIIQTKWKIQFSQAVGPVCLPYNFYKVDGSYDVTALGWGLTEFSGPSSPYLQKVDLSSVTKYDCSTQITQNTIFPSQMCVYGFNKDTCIFDSGGPLIYYDRNVDRYMLVGLVSYGIACGSQLPSVNTRVTSFGDFVLYYTSFKMGKGYCDKYNGFTTRVF